MTLIKSYGPSDSRNRRFCILLGGPRHAALHPRDTPHPPRHCSHHHSRSPKAQCCNFRPDRRRHVAAPRRPERHKPPARLSAALPGVREDEHVLTSDTTRWQQCSPHPLYECCVAAGQVALDAARRSESVLRPAPCGGTRRCPSSHSWASLLHAWAASGAPAHAQPRAPCVGGPPPQRQEGEHGLHDATRAWIARWH